MCPLVLPAEQSGHYDDNGIDIDLIFSLLCFGSSSAGGDVQTDVNFSPIQWVDK